MPPSYTFDFDATSDSTLQNAATYIQRVFRGIHDRNMVIRMAVEQQVAQAQGRVGGNEDEEEKIMPALVESRKARYQLKR